MRDRGSCHAGSGVSRSPIRVSGCRFRGLAFADPGLAFASGGARKCETPAPARLGCAPTVDPRIETSLTRAIETRDPRDLLERAGPALGLPGPRPRMEAAREIGLVLAREGERGRALARLLGGSEREDARVIAAAAFGAFAASTAGAGGAGGATGRGKSKRNTGHPGEALAALEELAEDVRGSVRHAVIDALRTVLAADLDGTLAALAGWTDGFLQAHVALEAIVDRKVLATLPSAEVVLALLEPAFRMADEAPRAADRWQGVRALRQGLPAQITAFVGRFGELFEWVLARAAATRPETREVMERTADALARASFRKSDVDALRDALSKSAKPPRDPSRVVQGTRKRSGR